MVGALLTQATGVIRYNITLLTKYYKKVSLKMEGVPFLQG